ncbi:MAG: hypothetical protein A2186_04510 [Candidatus Levybacteria bacterium RIFOXYA1_FULL_41_10]|nr:MAG: Cell shape-determining protein MreC [Candidatus Levybacteria bacterium GW2011_GWA1_39_34]KKR50781.1 MAG: Cell shape-determining protein MreC [Candidatus Levybacteria bacterium GW2011_GWC1_40_19]KKR72981.1 MAG: Cell shape-determining protein MreC [Candidatus Levybacteria bacterium GW2011_GWC2_40_7]KKR93983.1 MAG: Cell shape-determining protein MreC [Candidatus Levybacteria bacterium GW2011_GWA2_41_15]OGH20395.1 MAG: hypothetical protein A2695_00260 [Candidatus Levybacteria bacterium RIFC
MHRKKILPVVAFFALLSVILILLSGAGRVKFIEGSLSFVFSPVQKVASSIFHIDPTSGSEIEKLRRENNKLLGRLKDQALLESENKALRDQFEIEYPSSSDLIPARVIGSPGLVPGVSKPEYFILDVGTKDGVRIGAAVIFGTNLVGKIANTNSWTSKVELITNSSSSFTAKAVSYSDLREAMGIIKGSGSDEMVFGNVLLSSVIKKDDLVLTKGDVDEKGAGFPPNLIVGKIISVEKNPSDLFQRGQVKSPVDFASVDNVFVSIR